MIWEYTVSLMLVEWMICDHHMGGSWNRGTPISSILDWVFPPINHPFFDSPFDGKPPRYETPKSSIYRWICQYRSSVLGFWGIPISGNPHVIPSGKLTVRYWKLQFIVVLTTKNGDFHDFCMFTRWYLPIEKCYICDKHYTIHDCFHVALPNIMLLSIKKQPFLIPPFVEPPIGYPLVN